MLLARRLSPVTFVCSLALFALGCSSDSGGVPPDASRFDGLDGAAPQVIAVGDFSKFSSFDFFDAHAHLESDKRASEYLKLQDRFGVKRMLLISRPRLLASAAGLTPTRNAEGLLAQLSYPTRFRNVAALDLGAAIAIEDPSQRAEELSRQVSNFAKIGVAGVELSVTSKVIETASGAGVDLLPDGGEIPELLGALEGLDLPVFVHVEAGLLKSVIAAAEQHSNVTFVVLGLGGAGGDLAQLEQVLQAGSNVYLGLGDVTQLAKLAALGEDARTFVISNADRLVVGLGLGATCEAAKVAPEQCPSESLALETAWPLRALLETPQKVAVQPANGKMLEARGLALPPDVLKKIYAETLARSLGTLRALDCQSTIEHVEALLGRTTDEGDVSRVTAIRDGIVKRCQK